MNTSAPGNRRRRRDVDLEDEEMDITPMIDMTFLLLIFFMVTSVVARSQGVELPDASSGTTEEVQDQVVLLLDFPNGIDKDAANAAPLTGAQPATLATARIFLSDDPKKPIPADQLEERLRREFQARGDGRFILQASRKMPVSVVREVLQIAKRAGATQSTVAVWIP